MKLNYLMIVLFTLPMISFSLASESNDFMKTGDIYDK